MAKLTRREAAIISAYTGITCGPFGDMHKYAEHKFGRQIADHEFGRLDLANALHDAAEEDFLALCADAEGEPPVW